MTSRGKLILTLLILGVAVFGAYRWWDKLAPTSRENVVSLNPQAIKDALAGKSNEDAAVASKLLAGDKAVSLVDGSAIPAVAGVSDYAKAMKDGKFIVQFPINVWPGWAPIIMANNGLEANEGSLFFKKYGFYV